MRGSGDVAAAKIVTEEAEINHTPRRRTDGRPDRRRTETLTFGLLIPSGEHGPTSRRNERNDEERIRVKAVPLSVIQSVSQSFSQSIRNYSFMRREREQRRML